MKIEVGKYYKTRDGRKVVIDHRGIDGGEFCYRSLDGAWYRDDGRYLPNYEHPNDLVAEWIDGPVRTVTRKEIVPGVYGKVEVLCAYGRGVDLAFPTNDTVWDAPEIRAAITTLSEIADAMEDQA